jgi:hypothetical protein
MNSEWYHRLVLQLPGSTEEFIVRRITVAVTITLHSFSFIKFGTHCQSDQRHHHRRLNLIQGADAAEFTLSGILHDCTTIQPKIATLDKAISKGTNGMAEMLLLI